MIVLPDFKVPLNGLGVLLAAPRQPGLYFLYQGEELVYIGMSTENVFRRLKDHFLKRTKFFDCFSYVTGITDLAQAETELIKHYQPRYNIAHNGKNQTSPQTRRRVSVREISNKRQAPAMVPKTTKEMMQSIHKINSPLRKDKIYHYKNGNKMEPVVILGQDEYEWIIFCQRIARQHPQDPHPYYEDVVRFKKERAEKNKLINQQPA